MYDRRFNSRTAWIYWRFSSASPVKKVKFFKGETKRVRYLLPGEVQTALSNCEDWLQPIVTVAVHTGMRRGEILGHKWDQVNFEQGIISILKAKNHERRDIPMDETVKASLKTMERKGEFVFVNGEGKAITGHAVQIAFHNAVEKSGIIDFHFHDLRHTFASNLVMQLPTRTL